MNRGHLPERTLPRQRRGPHRWLASEWGLGALALVLAVLVWVVVWGQISRETRIVAELELRCSPEFVAYADGNVVFTLEGPRREVEEARQALGSRVVVRMKDLEPGQLSTPGIPIGRNEEFLLPFSPRLVKHIEGTQADMFRLRPHTLRIEKPEVVGLPDGYQAEVSLKQDILEVDAPAEKLDDTIQPDAIGVASLFQAYQDGELPPPQGRTLRFTTWWGDPQEKRYRADIELPEIQAIVRFLYEEPREIRNRLEFRVQDGEEGYRISADADIVDHGYYRGRFQGPREELESLEKNLEEWWFVVRIPGDKLPAGKEEVTDSRRVEYVDVVPRRRRRVKFEPASEILVVIRREEEE